MRQFALSDAARVELNSELTHYKSRERFAATTVFVVAPQAPPKGRTPSHLSANRGSRIKSCRQASGFNFDQSQRSANSGRRDKIRRG
jgi:hypothetical protein